MSSSTAAREFNKQIATALNSMIKVILEYEYPTHYYTGRLIGIDLNQTICLDNARNEKKRKLGKIFIQGSKWVSFVIEGEPFPMDGLAIRLRKVLPGESIQIGEDNSINVLGGKIKITEKGVEGRGPTAERIQKVFDAFIADLES
ncbi:MAG: Lsm family RNA-binding protein [Promethearchaeota archaeon]